MAVTKYFYELTISSSPHVHSPVTTQTIMRDVLIALAPALVGDNALPVSAVAALIQHNTSGIISRKGEGMETPKGMEGKKYATWEGPIELETIRKVVEADGGDYSKVELIPSTVTDEVSALKTKSVDAIWIFYGWAGVKTELAGIDTDYFAFADIDPVLDYYTPVVISGNAFLEENPETAKAFLAALAKGYEDAIADPEKAADILCKAAPELDKELVLASQKYLSAQYKAEVERWGYIDPARWNAFYNWLNEKGLSDPKLPENVGFTACGVLDKRSGGNHNHEILGSLAEELVTLAVLAVAGYELVLITESEQGVGALINAENYASALAAVSAVGAAVRNVFLAVKGYRTISAVACLYVNFNVIYKHKNAFLLLF